MFKKLKALWQAAVAIVIVCIVIIILTVTVPILLGLLAIAFVSIVGYVTFQESK